MARRTSHGPCVVTARYSLSKQKGFWQTTAPEVRLPRLSPDAGMQLLQTLGVKGSELRNIPFDAPPGSEAPKRASQGSPGQRPGLTDENDPALKGRDKAMPHDGATPSGFDAGDAQTQGVALGCNRSGRWPADSESGSTGGKEMVNEFEKLVADVKGHARTLTLPGGFPERAFQGDIHQRDRVKFEKADGNFRRQIPYGSDNR